MSTSRVDLSSSSVRKNFGLSEAEWLVKTAGFDGIQWDYEVCPDGDRPLLSLLDGAKATLPGISVSRRPAGIRPVRRRGWTSNT